jgi:hypothetical protein
MDVNVKGKIILNSLLTILSQLENISSRRI